MGELTWGSFRLQRSDSCLSKIVGRSKSSRLVLESVSSECVGHASYERLSQSMRFFDEPRRKQKSQVWRFLTRAISGKNCDDREVRLGKDDLGRCSKEKIIDKEKKKKRSSWLPDPSRRWPVQGW